MFCVVTCTAGLIWPYFLCHSASLASLEVASTAKTVYNSKWYEYPVSVRKHAVLMIALSHKERNLTGLKIIPCSLEAFLKVSIASIFIFIYNKQIIMEYVFFVSSSINRPFPTTLSSRISQRARIRYGKDNYLHFKLL